MKLILTTTCAAALLTAPVFAAQGVWGSRGADSLFSQGHAYTTNPALFPTNGPVLSQRSDGSWTTMNFGAGVSIAGPHTNQANRRAGVPSK